MQTIENAIVDRDVLKNVIENIEYNKTIVNYYHKLISESSNIERNTLFNKVNSLDNCNKFWVLDKYEIQKLKDLKKQNLCKDKFCSNCKKVKQSGRMARYTNELESYKDKLYHLTLTLPNVDSHNLKDTIKHMAKCFRKLISYIRCEASIKDTDFSSWGYEGAIRSLEVTFKRNNYHPHYHVGIVLNEDMVLNKEIINSYSYNYSNGRKELVRAFSHQEILIQKIWYLLINNLKVSKDNIDNLEEGYSCTMDKFPADQYAELFKYMTKDKDQEGKILSYDNFKTLYYSLYRVKQIQGYGCLYRITDDIDLEEYERLYEEFIAKIRQKEIPAEVLERPQELILDTDYKLISRKSYFKYLKSLS